MIAGDDSDVGVLVSIEDDGTVYAAYREGDDEHERTVCYTEFVAAVKQLVHAADADGKVAVSREDLRVACNVLESAIESGPAFPGESYVLRKWAERLARLRSAQTRGQ